MAPPPRACVASPAALRPRRPSRPPRGPTTRRRRRSGERGGEPRGAGPAVTRTRGLDGSREGPAPSWRPGRAGPALCWHRPGLPRAGARVRLRAWKGLAGRPGSCASPAGQPQLTPCCPRSTAPRPGTRLRSAQAGPALAWVGAGTAAQTPFRPVARLGTCFPFCPGPSCGLLAVLLPSATCFLQPSSKEVTPTPFKGILLFTNVLAREQWPH